MAGLPPITDTELGQAIIEARALTECARDAWRRCAQVARKHRSEFDSVDPETVDPETAYRVMQALTPVVLSPRGQVIARVLLKSTMQAFFVAAGPARRPLPAFVDWVVRSVYGGARSEQIAAWYEAAAQAIRDRPQLVEDIDMDKASDALGVDLRAELEGPRYTLDDVRADRAARKDERPEGWTAELADIERRLDDAALESALLRTRARALFDEEAWRPIAEAIRSQDNCATEQPIFIVQERQAIVGVDRDYHYDAMVWVDEEDPSIVYDDPNDIPEGSSVRHVYERHQWVFVTACFTRAGCQRYIDENAHRLREPRIYAEGSYRNHEFRRVRALLLELLDGAELAERVAAEAEEAKKGGCVSQAFASKEDAAAWLDRCWPCTIIATRYGGAYERGTWAAFASEEVPEEATAGDSDAEMFWRHSREGEMVGRGDSPDAALADLRRRLEVIAAEEPGS